VPLQVGVVTRPDLLERTLAIFYVNKTRPVT
jgi:hypothetical protein